MARNEMTNGIFLLLGSNEGNSFANLSLARENIGRHAGTIIRSSLLYRTAAWGMTRQPDFINQVLEISSPHPPEILLRKILDIEESMGRVRGRKWGPRLIDIDVLFYGQEVRNTASLVLPHPGIPQRKFTLIPLAEIAPDLFHPVLKKTVAQLLTSCTDKSLVEPITI